LFHSSSFSLRKVCTPEVVGSTCPEGFCNPGRSTVKVNFPRRNPIGVGAPLCKCPSATSKAPGKATAPWLKIATSDRFFVSLCWIVLQTTTSLFPFWAVVSGSVETSPSGATARMMRGS